MKKYIYLVIGESESGDSYHHILDHKPTTKERSKIAHGWDGDEEKEGPGEDGSYLYLEIKKLEVHSVG